MGYIEKKESDGQNYWYFVKTFPFMGKQHKISRYIGKSPLISKEDYLLKNIHEITEQEFQIKKPYFPSEMAYGNLLEKTEKKAIYLNNIIEAKNNMSIVEKFFVKEFVYNSNNIEGSKLPKQELEKILENEKTSYANKNEILEAENSVKAFNYLKEKFYFTIPQIKKLYHKLTKNLVMETGDKYARGFRKMNIVVGNEKTSSPKEISSELNSLLQSYKKKRKSYPLKLAFDFHLHYEQIHPFRDGNGRTGRLIMNKILMQNNYFPMIVFKDNKTAYFNAIKQGIKGKKKKYWQFMLEQQYETYKLIEKIAEK